GGAAGAEKKRETVACLPWSKATVVVVRISAARSESFTIAKPEPSTVTGLVVGAGTEILRVTGIRLLQLSLAVEIPVSAVHVLIFLAGLAAFDEPLVVAGPVGTRRILRSRRVLRSCRVRCGC